MKLVECPCVATVRSIFYFLLKCKEVTHVKFKFREKIVSRAKLYN
jgi:hypothetical protein